MPPLPLALPGSSHTAGAPQCPVLALTGVEAQAPWGQGAIYRGSVNRGTGQSVATGGRGQGVAGIPCVAPSLHMVVYLQHDQRPAVAIVHITC